MKLKIATLITLTTIFCAGCVSSNSVIVATGTLLGIKVAQNPATQLYQAELGFSRAEFGYIPLNGTNRSANVMMELKYSNLFTGGGLYQRLAVGDIAVGQPGASLLFAKDSSGNLSLTNLNNIPLLLKPQH
jgi:hypothetical protein